MAKIKKIPIYLKDISDNFILAEPRTIYGRHDLHITKYNFGGKFLVADMPQGDSVFSSLN